MGYHWTKRVARDSDANWERGPLKTKSIGKTKARVYSHYWYAFCELSNSDPTLTKGNWEGYADVPHQDPDQDYKYKVNGIVNESFSRHDTDWFASHNTKKSIDDCSAWAYISMFDGVNFIAYDSYSHVPF